MDASVRYVMASISRLGFDWHTRQTPIGSDELAAAMAPLLTDCIERFGPDRCMFESNFPPDKVSFSHHVLFNAFKRFSTGYSAAERATLLDQRGHAPAGPYRVHLEPVTASAA